MRSNALDIRPKVALTLQKVVASCSINPSIVNIADMEARTGCRYRRGKAWLCREGKVDNGNTWETLDAEVGRVWAH